MQKDFVIQDQPVCRPPQSYAGLPGQGPMVNLEIYTCLDVALVVNAKSSEN